MKEQSIERYFTYAALKAGGVCIKLSSTSVAGLPDRMVLAPFGKVFFVEFKAPGENLRPVQILRKKMLDELGFTSYCVDCKEMADIVLKQIFKP